MEHFIKGIFIFGAINFVTMDFYAVKFKFTFFYVYLVIEADAVIKSDYGMLAVSDKLVFFTFFKVNISGKRIGGSVISVFGFNKKHRKIIIRDIFFGVLCDFNIERKNVFFDICAAFRKILFNGYFAYFVAEKAEGPGRNGKDDYQGRRKKNRKAFFGASSSEGFAFFDEFRFDLAHGGKEIIFCHKQ